MGSLVNGAGGGIQGLIVSNCTFNGTDYGLRIKSDRDRGGLVQNLQYLDITMTNVGYAIVFYTYYNSVGTPNSITPFRASTDTVHAVTGTTPIYQNIMISNVTASALTGSHVTGIFWGLPEMLISNVTLCDVNISATNKTFCIYNAQGIQIIDSQLSTATRTNVLTLFNAQITVTNSVLNTNLVTLGGLSTSQGSNTLAFFNTLAAITDTNTLGTASITMGGSMLAFTQDSASVADNLSIISTSTVAVASGTNSFTGALSGLGPLTLDLIGSSSLALQGDSTGFGGSLTISNGIVLVDNMTGSGTGMGAVTVAGTATLGGNGVITGPVTENGTFTPGNNGVGTLTISNNFMATSGATLAYALGTNSCLAVVNGNLTLDGTVNVADAGGFTFGAYTLFSYTGTLTTNGTPSILTIGSVPNTNLIYSIDISSNGFIRLIVSPPPPTVALTSPPSGIVGNTITLSAVATDDISVVKVEFYRDNNDLLGLPPHRRTR